MFSETSFLLVFGLGAVCMLLGFFLVVRGIGTSDSESAIKVIGIEIKASKVGPGVLFALFGLVLVITAIAKQQAPAPASPSAAKAPAPAPPQGEAQAKAQAAAVASPGAAAPNADPADLVADLARHNVHGSQGDAALREWTESQGAHYRQIAEATLAALGPRRFAGAGVDLLKVNYFYLREFGVDDEAKLPPGHVIDPARLQRALVLAHRDMNGGAATSLGEIAR
jgi:hypothetical protein